METAIHHHTLARRVNRLRYATDDGKRNTCVEYLYDIVFVSTHQLVPINQLLSKRFPFVSASQNIDYSVSRKSFIEAAWISHSLLIIEFSLFVRDVPEWGQFDEGVERRDCCLLPSSFVTSYISQDRRQQRSRRTCVCQRQATTSSISYWLVCSLFSEWYIIQSERAEGEDWSSLYKRSHEVGSWSTHAFYLSLLSPFLFCVIF